MRLSLSRVWLVFLLLSATTLVMAQEASTRVTQPNVVYILANDLGWRDVGFHGGRVSTPHIDRLAKNGARLESFYTMHSSSATRAAILSGQYPYRLGFQMMSLLPWSRYGLPESGHYLGTRLKAGGYQTAYLGSWLLGHTREEYLPMGKGFDYFYGNLTPIGDHLKKVNITGQPDWFIGQKPAADEGYATDLVATRAAQLIEKHNSDQPLFLMVSFPAPSAPIQASNALIERAEKEILSFNIFVSEEQKITRDEDKIYLAMVGQLDDGVGKIMDALTTSGMSDNTLVIFHSDNGGAVKRKYLTGDGDVLYSASDNGPFRSGSGSYYEGGLRVPALLSWPEKIKPNISTERTHVTDMYATILDAAQLTGEDGFDSISFDGESILPIVTENKLSGKEHIILNVNEFGGAVLDGNWKYIWRSTFPPEEQLFDIGGDASEDINVISKYPEIATQLKRLLMDASEEMATSLYLIDLERPSSHETPIIWGDNPTRP